MLSTIVILAEETVLPIDLKYKAFTYKDTPITTLQALADSMILSRLELSPENEAIFRNTGYTSEIMADESTQKLYCVWFANKGACTNV
jgi:hypothetical protein